MRLRPNALAILAAAVAVTSCQKSGAPVSSAPPTAVVDGQPAPEAGTGPAGTPTPPATVPPTVEAPLPESEAQRHKRRVIDELQADLLAAGLTPAEMALVRAALDDDATLHLTAGEQTLDHIVARLTDVAMRATAKLERIAATGGGALRLTLVRTIAGTVTGYYAANAAADRLGAGIETVMVSLSGTLDVLIPAAERNEALTAVATASLDGINAHAPGGTTVDLASVVTKGLISGQKTDDDFDAAVSSIVGGALASAYASGAVDKANDAAIAQFNTAIAGIATATAAAKTADKGAGAAAVLASVQAKIGTQVEQAAQAAGVSADKAKELATEVAIKTDGNRPAAVPVVAVWGTTFATRIETVRLDVTVASGTTPASDTDATGVGPYQGIPDMPPQAHARVLVLTNGVSQLATWSRAGAVCGDAPADAWRKATTSSSEPALFAGLPDGPAVLCFAARNGAGAGETKSVALVRDTTPPAAALVGAPQGKAYGQPRISVSDAYAYKYVFFKNPTSAQTCATVEWPSVSGDGGHVIDSFRPQSLGDADVSAESCCKVAFNATYRLCVRARDEAGNFGPVLSATWEQGASLAGLATVPDVAAVVETRGPLLPDAGAAAEVAAAVVSGHRYVAYASQTGTYVVRSTTVGAFDASVKVTDLVLSQLRIRAVGDSAVLVGAAAVPGEPGDGETPPTDATHEVVVAWTTDQGSTWVTRRYAAETMPIHEVIDVQFDETVAVVLRAQQADDGNRQVYADLIRMTAGTIDAPSVSSFGEQSWSDERPAMALDSARFHVAVPSEDRLPWRSLPRGAMTASWSTAVDVAAGIRAADEAYYEALYGAQESAGGDGPDAAPAPQIPQEPTFQLTSLASFGDRTFLLRGRRTFYRAAIGGSAGVAAWIRLEAPSARVGDGEDVVYKDIYDPTLVAASGDVLRVIGRDSAVDHQLSQMTTDANGVWQPPTRIVDRVGFYSSNARIAIAADPVGQAPSGVLVVYREDEADAAWRYVQSTSDAPAWNSASSTATIGGRVIGGFAGPMQAVRLGSTVLARSHSGAMSRSADGGLTWQAGELAFDASAIAAGSDTYYAVGRGFVAASPNGLDWDVRHAGVAVSEDDDQGGQSPLGATIAAAYGSNVAIAYFDEGEDSDQASTLYTTRSVDKGVTWSAPQALLTFQGSYGAHMAQPVLTADTAQGRFVLALRLVSDEDYGTRIIRFYGAAGAGEWTTLSELTASDLVDNTTFAVVAKGGSLHVAAQGAYAVHHGSSWSAPALHGAKGRVALSIEGDAVVIAGDVPGELHVVKSADSGATFAAPVKLDLHDAAGYGPAFDPSGYLYNSSSHGLGNKLYLPPFSGVAP